MKIEKIESIDDIDSLVGLISQILEKLGLTEIERTRDNVLSAKEVSPLKKRTAHFILTLSELNGKTPSILNVVNKIKEKSDNVYVVTSDRKLSNYFKKWLEKESEFANLNFWSREDLIELIDEYLTDFWSHGDSFSVLTQNKEPNWKVSSCETSLKSQSGGANHLAKLLIDLSKKIEIDYDKDKTVIGVFDNDAKGSQEFNGLRDDFVFIDNRTRKHNKLNIYAIKLPIPPTEEYSSYNQEKQSFRFFEIEHYFPLPFLKELDMVSATSIPKVFEIKDKKSNFADKIIKKTEPELFKHFVFLFREIDRIIGDEINYIE